MTRSCVTNFQAGRWLRTRQENRASRTSRFPFGVCSVIFSFQGWMVMTSWWWTRLAAMGFTVLAWDLAKQGSGTSSQPKPLNPRGSTEEGSSVRRPAWLCVINLTGVIRTWRKGGHPATCSQVGHAHFEGVAPSMWHPGTSAQSLCSAWVSGVSLSQ